MSIIIFGLPLAIIGGIYESVLAFVRKPRIKVHRHKAKTFGYYWEV